MASPFKRKLAAVMFTDIAGYTEAMSKSEQKALEMLRRKRKIIRPLIEEHKGVFVKEIGDGTLSYFESGFDASKCAVQLQKDIKADDDLNLRVGIHIGDIVFEDEDVYGEGVNVASRLESMAPVGGVFVSSHVYDELINKEDFEGVSLGLQSLKGLGRLIEVYALVDEKLSTPNPDDYQEEKVQVHSDDEVPSIAIIPLKNKGADEDVFYAYGISADLIKACTSAGLIRVESMDRIEKIDNYEKLDIKDLASKLSVRYITTGTLWKMGEMFQLSIELYDSRDSKVVWSDYWQEKWENLTNIKSDISDGALKALDTKPKMVQKEISTNPEAYEHYLRGLHQYEKRTNIEETEIAQELLKKAIELDENLIKAWLLLGWSYYLSGDASKAITLYEDILQRVIEIDDKSGESMCLRRLGVMYSDIENDLIKGLDFTEKSLVIAEKLNDKELISHCLEFKANIFSQQDLYDKSLDYYLQTLDLREKISKRFLPQTYNNIGHYYLWIVPDISKALEYFQSALDNSNAIGDLEGKAWALSSFGFSNWIKGNYQKALKFYEESMYIFKELGNNVHTAQQIIWISLMHFELGDMVNSKKMINESENIFKTVKNKFHRFEFVATSLLVKKELGLEYDLKELDEYLIAKKRDKRVMHFVDWYYLYKLTGNRVELGSAYNRLLELSDRVNSNLKEKLFSYPISKQIKQDWEKV